ncbi:hypothetical protein [Streptomyces bambusae]|uniref:Hsp20/alpha crystallin family protein n=1 Tax=Streptomyces bambusae TaxID=1550616 RepID=A0ABS6YYW6_9ACTN|nr:hypothetical protein [Streptomyces bambusae]MBW5480556.1 hypothetical protein [Streptomyces bambusae]
MSGTHMERGVEAAYEDGILTVRVPMETEPPAGRRSIPVTRRRTPETGERS